MNIVDVIFNNVAGPKHLRTLEASLRDMECLGGMRREPSAELHERHLGLVPSGEAGVEEPYDRITELVEESLDVDAILSLARSAPPLPFAEPQRPRAKSESCEIAVARDAAFNFYYEDNLDILWEMGASLRFFSPLDDRLPDADGYYLGGGYPEVFAERLSKNVRITDDLRKAAARGLPIYAECGGLMYLCSGIADRTGKRHPMCGVFRAEAEMTGELQAVSYVEAKITRDSVLARRGWGTRGHVFHFSRIVGVHEPYYSYELKGGVGIDVPLDGLVSQNTLASYTHLHFGSCPRFAARFVESCAHQRRK